MVGDGAGVLQRVNAHDPRFWMPGEQMPDEIGADKPGPSGHQYGRLAKTLHCVMVLEKCNLIKSTRTFSNTLPLRQCPQYPRLCRAPCGSRPPLFDSSVSSRSRR